MYVFFGAPGLRLLARKAAVGPRLRGPRARCYAPRLRSFSIESARRRGGRAVEGARLESVYTGNRIAGSNPAPSATLVFRHLSPPFAKP